MAKAIFFSLPLHGHTNPSLPLIKELVCRGEQILYYSTDSFQSRIEETQAQFCPYRNAFLGDLRTLPERLEELNWLLIRTTAEVLEQELNRIRAEQPAYVITDSSAPWGQWIGQILRVPVVTSISTFAFNRRVLAYGVTRGVRPKSAKRFLSKLRHIAKTYVFMRKLRALYGVPGPGLMGTVVGTSELNVVYTSRLFQPCAESFGERFEFIGPAVAARSATPEFPWESIRHPVLLYVSMGTLFNTDASFYLRCFETFANRDCQVILSTGNTIPLESLGTPPANFIVRSQVPQLDVLQRAAAFVTHGGMNSVSESLYYGVPMLVIPQMGEQGIVACRVAELGAGIHLSNAGATAENLWNSVSRLLAEESFRHRAENIRESFLQAGGVPRAADAILNLVRHAGSGLPASAPAR